MRWQEDENFYLVTHLSPLMITKSIVWVSVRWSNPDKDIGRFSISIKAVFKFAELTRFPWFSQYTPPREALWLDWVHKATFISRRGKLVAEFENSYGNVKRKTFYGTKKSFGDNSSLECAKETRENSNLPLTRSGLFFRQVIFSMILLTITRTPSPRCSE